MYRQAHVLLCKYLTDGMQDAELKNHFISLSIGSIMPDTVPRMRMIEHEFEGTWEETKARIRGLESAILTDKKEERAACRQFGIVLHYLADYFTCPHNPSYGIDLIGHGIYEGWEAYKLRRYLYSPKANRWFFIRKKYAGKISSTEELFSYIERMHALYLKKRTHTPCGDCRWILDVCTVTAVVLASKMYGTQGRTAD